MTPSTAHFPLDQACCPWCEYDVSGIHRLGTCPECGSDMGTLSRARAAMARAAQDRNSRLILLLSPVAAILASVPLFAARGAIGALTVLVSTLLLGGILSIARLGRSPGSPRRLGMVVAVGSMVAILYMTFLVGAAVLIILPISLLARNADSSPNPWVLVSLCIPLVVIEAGLILVVVRWLINRLAGRRHRPR
ncbi:MAG: hypothetical protein KF787_13790 [Phycisphaeraceae bacterium]|nr:hypothetical protein [Phycisphaerae bacterium]MBX3393707.1 hypothetical protein [Phycisphaeraceae bacterium]HRJ49305.1 hypothetical protein [Phycisphaerales bacterium]